MEVRPRNEEQGESPSVRLELGAFGRRGRLESVRAASWREGACRTDGARDVDGSCPRRVETERGAELVEWWENRPDELEQGFTVGARPAGEGPLVLVVRVTGAELAQDGQDVRLDPDRGAPMRYAGLTAVDAAGPGARGRDGRAGGGCRPPGG